jgi:hypothetical protein
MVEFSNNVLYPLVVSNGRFEEFYGHFRQPSAGALLAKLARHDLQQMD